jgi:hypothetical protein
MCQDIASLTAPTWAPRARLVLVAEHLIGLCTIKLHPAMRGR